MDHSGHNHLVHMLSELNPLDFFELVSIFSFSFLSSLHCAFMCAPLVCSYMGDRTKLTSPGIWLYNLGRILSYAVAGWLLGATGEFLMGAIPHLGSLIAKVLGAVLIFVGLWQGAKLLNLWQRDLSWPEVKLTAVVSVIKKWPLGLRDFGFGIITVLLPCMTLTPVLALAATSSSATKGGLLMLAFGMGTLPVMLGATYVPALIYRKIPPFLLRWVTVFFLLTAGMLTLAR